MKHGRRDGTHAEVRLTYRLWVPGPLPGINEIVEAAKGAGGTGTRYSSLKARWTNDIALLAKVAHIPHMERVHLTFLWWERDRRRDPDNICGGGRKLVLDGLVRAGVIAKDGWKQLAGPDAGWVDSFDVGRPGVEVLIREV
jgi:hypothetical protein